MTRPERKWRLGHEMNGETGLAGAGGAFHRGNGVDRNLSAEIPERITDDYGVSCPVFGHAHNSGTEEGPTKGAMPRRLSVLDTYAHHGSVSHRPIIAARLREILLGDSPVGAERSRTRQALMEMPGSDAFDLAHEVGISFPELNDRKADGPLDWRPGCSRSPSTAADTDPSRRTPAADPRHPVRNLHHPVEDTAVPPGVEMVPDRGKRG